MNYNKKNISHETLGERIKFVRSDILRLTQAELAAKLGFETKATISNWENNINEPDIQVLLTIAKMADVSLYWLLAKEGNFRLQNSVAEKKETYGIHKEDIEFLLSIWHIPEARTKHLQYMFKKLEGSKLLEEIDKERFLTKKIKGEISNERHI